MNMITTLVFAFAAFSSGDGMSDLSKSLPGVDPEWLQSMEAEKQQQFEILTAAYDLSEEKQTLLAELLNKKVIEQWHYEQQALAELGKAVQKLEMSGSSNPESPEALAAMAKAREVYERMPLNVENNAAGLEAFLPASAIKQGRKRLKELQHLRTQKVLAIDKDAARRAGQKASIIQARRVRTAELSSSGKPLPQGVAVPARPKSEPVRPLQGVTKRNQGAKATQASGKSLPPIPPLDDWVKYTFQVEKKYKFNDKQKAQAQSILTDLYVRAYNYLKSQPGAYDRLEKTTSKTEYRKLLKEMKLDKTFDALFEELRQRLEKLPTTEQRQKAASKTSKSK